MKGTDPILDWHLNNALPEAAQVLAEARVASLLAANSLDPIYRQLDEAVPTWRVYGPDMGWQLLRDDYLFHNNIGTLIPAANAWHMAERIVVYRFAVICIIQPDDSFTVGKIV